MIIPNFVYGFLIAIVFVEVVNCLENVHNADVKKVTNENSELKIPTNKSPSSINLPVPLYWKTPSLPTPQFTNENLQVAGQTPPLTYPFQQQPAQPSNPNISPIPQTPQTAKTNPTYLSNMNPDLLSFYFTNLLQQQQTQPIVQPQQTIEQWPQQQLQNQYLQPQKQLQQTQWLQPQQPQNWPQPQQDLFPSHIYNQPSQQIPQLNLGKTVNSYDQYQSGLQPEACQQLLVENQKVQQSLDYYKLLVATLQTPTFQQSKINKKNQEKEQEPIQLVSKLPHKPESVFGPSKIKKEENEGKTEIERPDPKPPLIQQFISEQVKKGAVNKEQQQQANSGID